MKLLIALFASLLTLTTHAANGCRVSERPCSWSEVRTLPAAPAGSTHVAIEACLYAEFQVAYENLTALDMSPPASCSFSDMSIQFQASLTPDFAQPFIDETITFTRKLNFTEGPFDGALDFGGGSGVQFNLEAPPRVVHIDADIADASAFDHPFQVYLRSSGIGSIEGRGNYIATSDPVSAAGVTFDFTAP